MTTFRSKLFFAAVLLIFTSLVGCKEDSMPDIEKPQDNGNIDLTIALADIFARNTMTTYYLWIDEEGRNEAVANVLDPDTCRNPIAAVKKLRHPDDKWTMLTDQFTALSEYSDGIDTSVGMHVIAAKINKESNRVLYCVQYVDIGSPAEQAGIKRGDIFLKFNGEFITTENYMNFAYATKTMTFTYGEFNGKTFSLLDKTVELTPVKFAAEPVIALNSFDINGKRVGYIAYNDFILSTETLEKSLKTLKDQGIAELVLDLRYNGGGYVSTCISLASMLAPKEAVEREDIFIKNVYNKLYTKALNGDTSETFDKKKLPNNLGITKIYALVGEGTASASELLIIGLMPYLDVTVIGEKTYGKFCTGVMLSPKNYYFDNKSWEEGHEHYNKYKDYFKDWGIYVMIGTYADKNDNNPARPNGILPDYEVMDNPFEGYQLGDERESLLHEALECAGKEYPEAQITRANSGFSGCQILPQEIKGVAINDIALSKLIH